PCEAASGEPTLVDLPGRAVVEDTLGHLLVDLARGTRRVDDDELVRDPRCLLEEPLAVRALQVAVEVTGEEAAEAAVVERESEGVALDERRLRRLLRSLVEHAAALVEPDDLAREMTRQEAGAARDVERAKGREDLDRRDQLIDLLLPARAISVGEAARAPIPVVVLGSACVVVLLHRAPRVGGMLESVPNFSEGRDAATIDAIGAALGTHARVLDVHADADHNRSVFTIVGNEDELASALVAGCAAAVDRIDLNAHAGVHPRIGAADVVPIVPLRPLDWERAQAFAPVVAKRIADTLALPVFLYAPPERGPAFYRRGGAGELARRLADGELAPDFGPRTLHASAGATMVGARRPLIAFNVNLRGTVDVAREIAAAVRER